MNVLLAILLVVSSIFLILLVLIQRGRGGGLAGAFGGLGGQSAFGTKAGDLFTKITIGVAGFWILLCIVSVKVMGSRTDQFSSGFSTPAKSTPLPQLGAGSKSGGAATEGGSKGTTAPDAPARDSAAPSSDGAAQAAGGGEPSGGAAAGGEKSEPSK